jgi:hypothetical protein
MRFHKIQIEEAVMALFVLHSTECMGLIPSLFPDPQGAVELGAESIALIR